MRCGATVLLRSAEYLRMISLQSIVVRSADVVATAVGPELILLHVTHGIYYSLNDTGGRTWQWLEQPMQVEDIVCRLGQEYGVAREICEPDVIRLLQQLEQQSLVTISG
jgi:Coenzyme PQQ synthesis protein D (PqqD)